MVYAANRTPCSISVRTSSVTVAPKDSIEEICWSSRARCAKSVDRSRLLSTAAPPTLSANTPIQRGSTITRSNVSRGDVRMPRTRALRPRRSTGGSSNPFRACMISPF